jgi:hypothetical protein
MTRIITSLFVFLLAFAASAQVVQPSYVRQSKGATITLFSNVTATTESAIFDMAPYAGLQIFATFASSPANCDGFIQTLGSGEKTANTFDFTDFDENGSYYFNDPVYPVSFTLSNVPQFVKFRFLLPGGSTCTGITVKVTPIPFPSRQIVIGTSSDGSYSTLQWPVITGAKTENGLTQTLKANNIRELITKPGGVAHTGSNYDADTSPVTIASNAGPATITYYAVNTENPVVQVQNVGTVDVVCGFLDTTSAATPQYSFKLYAKTAAYLPNQHDVYGLGAVTYVPAVGYIYRDILYCISTTGATGLVSVTAY